MTQWIAEIQFETSEEVEADTREEAEAKVQKIIDEEYPIETRIVDVYED